MNPSLLGATLALPWILSPLITVLRVRNTVSLNSELPDAPESPPLVSVIIPARNEARNIGRCIRSVLTTSYPNCEVVVVDDQSTDATGVIARKIASSDARVSVIDNTPPPAGWFGKQWACTTGAHAARGSILCFADADTTHSPDLLTRCVNAILRRKADLFSVLGTQELGSFWERLIQPQIFGLLAMRYGGTESITNSPHARDKLANGQCLFVTRSAYDELGGHSLVKSHVADDMMMAQRFFRHGKHVVLEEGLNQLSTRMYTSLGELVHGWGKNVFAGGRDSVPMGKIGRLFFPFALLAGPLSAVIPVLVLLLSPVVAFPPAVTAWAAIVAGVLLVWWLVAYSRIDESLIYAFMYPVGAAVVLYIFARAVLRGQNVQWKGREYVSA